MRTLAIDLGAKRVGLALGDESGRFASPLAVLEVRSPEHAAELVADAAKKQDARQLLVGLPLNMDGTSGPAARAALEWGRALAARCLLPVIFVDERLSSFAADQDLLGQKRQGRKITRKKRKQRQDALAALDFLQGYLDGRLQPIDPSRSIYGF